MDTHDHRHLTAELGRAQRAVESAAADLSATATRCAAPDAETTPGGLALAAGRLEAALARRDLLRSLLGVSL